MNIHSVANAGSRCQALLAEKTNWPQILNIKVDIRWKGESLNGGFSGNPK
jgi:hypothetical protein